MKTLIIIIFLSFTCGCSKNYVIDNKGDDLYSAAKIGNYKKVQLLINNGADVNYRKQLLSNDDYPLNAAIYSGNIEIVKLLIMSGAKIDTEKENRFCLSDAIYKENKVIIRYLLSKGIHVDKSCSSSLIFSAMYSRSFDMMKYVIEDLHVCIDSRETHYQHTPLYKTVCEDLYQEAQYLIKRGANVNIPNKDNETPLHVAVTWKRFKFIELLLKNGADPTTKDAKGLTPLDYAKKENNPRVLALLKRYGK